jgi:hypothetical protein
MNSAKRGADERRVLKPTRESVQSKVEDTGQAAVEPVPSRGRSISQLPSGPGTRALRQAAVVQMQRAQGNSMVMRQLMPGVQRQHEEEPANEGSGPSEISSAGSHVTTSGGGVELSGPTVTIRAPMTQAEGVIRASTIIADNVLASSYSPGAGNVM